MISLCKITIVALALAAAPGTHAQTAPSQVPANINQITNKYQALQPTVNSITILNGPLVIAGAGPYPQVGKGLNDIASTQTTQAQQMSGATADGDSVYNAYSDLARVATDTLNLLTAKAGMFKGYGFIGSYMVPILQNLAKAQNTYESTLEKVGASRASDIATKGKQISDAIAACTKAYSAIAIAKREALEEREAAGPISRIKRGVVVA